MHNLDRTNLRDRDMRDFCDVIDAIAKEARNFDGSNEALRRLCFLNGERMRLAKKIDDRLAAGHDATGA